MPSVIINEKDYTIYNKGLESNNIVYVPGFSITGPIDRPVLLAEYRDLVNIFGNVPPESYGPAEATNTTYHVGTGWEYAAGLLNAGFTVLFRRLVPLKCEVKDGSSGTYTSTVYDADDPANSIYDLTFNGNKLIARAETDFKVNGITCFKIYEKFGGTYGNRLRFSLVLNKARNKIFYKLEEVHKGTTVLEYFEVTTLETIKKDRSKADPEYNLLNALESSIETNSEYIHLDIDLRGDEGYSSCTNFERAFIPDSWDVTSSELVDGEIKETTITKSLSDDKISIADIAAGVRENIRSLPLGSESNTHYHRENKEKPGEYLETSAEGYSATGSDGKDFTINEAMAIQNSVGTLGTARNVSTIGDMLVHFLAEIEDKIQYDVKFITKGNISDYDDNELLGQNGVSYATTAMTLCSEARRDCMVITEPKLNTDKKEVADLLNGPFSDYEGAGSSYVAAYAPWAVTTLFNGYKRWMAPSFIFLVSLAKSVASGNPVYLPPAGVNRATLPEVVYTEFPIGSKLLDEWQNKDNQINLNPIMRLNNYGYVIYGQRTLYDVSDSVTSYRSALQEVGVRLTTLEIKKKIYQIAIGLTFEYNNIHTWNEFKSQLEPLLIEMLENGALQNYQVIMDMSTMSFDDIDDNKIKGTVKIIPGRAVEDFIISFELYRSSVVFDNEEDALGY